MLWVQVRVLPSQILGDAGGEIDGTTWDAVKQRYADRVDQMIERYAPSFGASVLGRTVLSPADLERDNPNLVGGDSLAGSHHLDQNFVFRPAFGWWRYKTPVKNLYLVGASTWPGAGVMKGQYGVESMPETGENVAEAFAVSRADQDAFAVRSQTRAAAAQASGRLAREIVPVAVPRRKDDPLIVETDEHPRMTSLEALAKLPTPFRTGGTVTAGNASGVNDGAAALIVASEKAARRHGLVPIARVLGGAVAGVPPRIMGIGPAPASQRLFSRLGLTIDAFDVIELNEAFASQGLATLRELGVADDDPRVNPNGGAIALGHPLGMSGARITGSAALDMATIGGRRSLSAMCIGVGQGIAIALERV